MKNNQQSLEFIPVELAKPEMMSELENCPIYEVIGKGVLKVNPGVKKPKSTLVYDISNTSAEFKSTLPTNIRMKGIVKIINTHIKSKNVKKDEIELLSLQNSYTDLSNEERLMLGHNFVTVVSTESGIEIKPYLVQRKTHGDIYLQIDSSTLSEELLEQIYSDITKLTLNSLGTYEISSKEHTEKSL